MAISCNSLTLGSHEQLHRFQKVLERSLCSHCCPRSKCQRQCSTVRLSSFGGNVSDAALTFNPLAFVNMVPSLNCTPRKAQSHYPPPLTHITASYVTPSSVPSVHRNSPLLSFRGCLIRRPCDRFGKKTKIYNSGPCPRDSGHLIEQTDNLQTMGAGLRENCSSVSP